MKEDPIKWGSSLSNELGRLIQGTTSTTGNNAITFIHRHHIPHNKKVAYANMVYSYCLLKEEKYRTRLTIGSDLLEYLEHFSSPAASLLKSKLRINIVVSDTHLEIGFMTADLKDYFLQSLLLEPEYLRIHGKYFSPNIREKYNIGKLIASDGYA